MHRLLGLLLLTPLAAHASDVKITVHGRIDVLVVLGALEPRGVPLPSRHHLSAPPERAKDSCTFVAGVRHCPRAEPR